MYSSIRLFLYFWAMCQTYATRDIVVNKPDMGPALMELKYGVSDMPPLEIML